MMKSIEAIKKQEKILRETLLAKTADLLSTLLRYVPTNSVLVIDDMNIKVIFGPVGGKTLLMNNRPLSTPDDCEWVIENYPALTQAVEELMNPEVEELIRVIGKTENLIQKVDELQKASEH
jgi:hypothetical protein